MFFLFYFQKIFCAWTDTEHEFLIENEPEESPSHSFMLNQRTRLRNSNLDESEDAVIEISDENSGSINMSGIQTNKSSNEFSKKDNHIRRKRLIHIERNYTIDESNYKYEFFIRFVVIFLCLLLVIVNFYLVVLDFLK